MRWRYAGPIVLPFLLMFSITLKARNDSRSAKPAEASAESNDNREDQESATVKLTPEQTQWVENTIRLMSVEEKVGQVLFATYHGSFTSTDSPAYTQMLHSINDLHVGGFITITHGSPLGIVKSQAYPTAVLTNQLQSKSKLPLLIGADFERGTAMRLDEGTSFPTAMALAAAGNPKDAYTDGKNYGSGSTRRGYSMDLRAGGRREQ